MTSCPDDEEEGGLDRPRREAGAEAARVLALCNVCNYCNGYCELFRAAERYQRFDDGTVAYLANLCHQCRNCWYACQYADPHPFAVNLPRALAEARLLSWRRRAWPAPLPRPALVAALLALLPPLLCLLLVPPDRLFAAHQGPGAFYAVIPWGVMSLAAALPLGLSALALGVGVARFWRALPPAAAPDSGAAMRRRAWAAALADLVALRNLQGGGGGCTDRDERFSHARRRLHHLLVAGVGLCFLATAVATLYHHALGWPAPYPLTSLPVLSGTLGGVAMVAAALGLLALRIGADPAPTTPAARPGDRLLLGQILATALSGLALLALRDGPLMGILLALHLGTVVSLFALLPFGKFAHAPYRACALLRAALDRQQP